jgi:hypothetical protein
MIYACVHLQVSGGDYSYAAGIFVVNYMTFVGAWRYPFIVQGILIIPCSLAILLVPAELITLPTNKQTTVSTPPAGMNNF